MQQRVVLAPTGTTLSWGYIWDSLLLGRSLPVKEKVSEIRQQNMQTGMEGISRNKSLFIFRMTRCMFKLMVSNNKFGEFIISLTLKNLSGAPFTCCYPISWADLDGQWGALQRFNWGPVPLMPTSQGIYSRRHRLLLLIHRAHGEETSKSNRKLVEHLLEMKVIVQAEKEIKSPNCFY